MGTALIRAETAGDAPRIIHVVARAFSPGLGEAVLVELLKAAGKAKLSLVAELDGELVGHILFSAVAIQPEIAGLKGIGLAPVGVLPAFQNTGIGSQLIRRGIADCAREGFDYMVVLGNPRYYARFGFVPASTYHLGSEYTSDEHFMAMELRPGALTAVKGLVVYEDEFREADC